MGYKYKVDAYLFRIQIEELKKEPWKQIIQFNGTYLLDNVKDLLLKLKFSWFIIVSGQYHVTTQNQGILKDLKED